MSHHFLLEKQEVKLLNAAKYRDCYVITLCIAEVKILKCLVSLFKGLHLQNMAPVEYNIHNYISIGI